MRYFTQVDYSQVPDSNYPAVNVANVNPSTIRTIWFIVAGVSYAAFLWLAYSRNPTMKWTYEALAFCLIGLLEPFTQKYALVILLFPAIVAGRIQRPQAARALIYMSIALVLIQPLISGSASQRLLQTIGLDFGATLLLTIALTFLPTVARRTA